MAQSYPRQFGKYVLISPLAQGGMGELHLALSGRADLKKLCVIKTILSHLADEEFTTRFMDEAKVVVKLSHGNLIPVLEAGQAEEQVFVAMEYIDGKDLRDVWLRCQERGKPMPADVALYVAREVCRGLDYVHNYGDMSLVHRDVSPPNVMLSFTGDVRVADFGVATSNIKLQKTAPGILLGKLSYMSPEQALNEPVDGRADLYSVGVILWELLTGERLFPPDGDLALRYERATSPTLIPPSTRNPELPPEIDGFMARALAPARDERFPDANSMRRALSELLGQISPAIDASAVQDLLTCLYRDDRVREQEALRQIVESAASELTGAIVSPRRMSGARGSGGAVTGGAGEESDETLIGLGAEELSPEALPETAAIIGPGTLIAGRYRLESLLGEGGMGRVFLATHVEIGKQVAVKILHPTYGRMPDLVRRFRHEARAATKIGNPHIVEVFDSGTTEDDSVYFVMEHLSGIDLADVLASEVRLSVERAVHISAQVCEAVAAAHEEGIVHRDLKPENIFLCMREGDPDFVKVLDFGLAQSVGLEQTRNDRLTSPGMAMGTPEYMAPEQAAGKHTDHRADIYALGTLLYEMLVGHPPHEGDTVMQVFNRKAVEPVVPPRVHRDEIPEELERLVMWSLEYAAEDRPQSMNQLAYELTKLSRGRAGAVASLLGLVPAGMFVESTTPPPPEDEPGAGGPPGAGAGAQVAGAAAGGDRGRSLTEPGLKLELTDGDDEAGGFDPAAATVFVPPLRAPGRRGYGLWVLAALGIATAGVAVVLALRQPSSGPEQRRSVRTSVAADAGERQPRQRRDASARVAVTPGAQDAAGAAALDGGRGGDSGGTSRPQRRAVQPGAWLARGRRHLLRGQFKSAREAFGAAARSPRLRGRAFVGLAEVEFQLGRYQAAAREAQRAERAGGGWRALLVLANASYKLRRYQRAVTFYQRVLRARPAHAEARRNLAAARARLGQ